MHKKNRLLLLFLSIIIISCSSGHRPFAKKEVRDVKVFLQADSTNRLAYPGGIKSVPGGIILADVGTHKIYRFNRQGHKLLSFGKKGKGPGEFQRITNFWKFNGKYIVYDRRSQKLITYDNSGTPIKDIPLRFANAPEMLPGDIQLINPGQFIMPSGGKNGTLWALATIATDSIRYFGKAVGKRGTIRGASAKLRHALTLSRGKNDVALSSNHTGIFAFQERTALLEKYTKSGKRLWTKSLKIPAVKNLFQTLLKKDRTRLQKKGKFLLTFQYATSIHATRQGVAVMLYTLKSQPIIVVWVPNDGAKITAVRFPKLKNPFPFAPNFTISNDGSHIYFDYIRRAKLYKARWPL